MSDLAVTSTATLTAADEEQLVTMTVDNQLFGIPILSVQDIVEPVQITPVPLASSAVAGVLNLRGRIVTVVDLRVCLGAEPKDLSERPMSVTVEFKGDLYTILVDSIGDVRSLPKRDLDKPPQTLDAKMRRLVSGVFRLENDLLAVLDVDRVLDPATINEAPPRRPLKRKKADPSKQKQAPRPSPASSGKSKADNDDSDGPATASAAPSSAPSAGSGPGVYERIGGELGVDAAVDIVMDKVIGDARLTPFLTADDSTIGQHAKAFLAEILGGPSKYRGPSLGELYSTLSRQGDFDDGHYIAVAAHLADALNQMGMPPELIDEVMEAVEGMRNAAMGR